MEPWEVAQTRHRRLLKVLDDLTAAEDALVEEVRRQLRGGQYIQGASYVSPVTVRTIAGSVGVSPATVHRWNHEGIQHGRRGVGSRRTP